MKGKEEEEEEEEEAEAEAEEEEEEEEEEGEEEGEEEEEEEEEGERGKGKYPLRDPSRQRAFGSFKEMRRAGAISEKESGMISRKKRMLCIFFIAALLDGEIQCPGC